MFVYNEETRIHTLGGKIIPSVSQVIEPLSDFSKIPKAILARKTELGTQFHDAIHAHLEDDLILALDRLPRLTEKHERLLVVRSFEVHHFTNFP